MMHVMQYCAPRFYNTVRDFARHMSQPSQKHTKERLHCLMCCADRPTRGLVLAPTRLWDGNSDFKFRICGDPDYANKPVDCRSVSGSVVMLEES